MVKIRCLDCGKVYDYDEDAFCPHCGAFNQPSKSILNAAAAAETAEPLMTQRAAEKGDAGEYLKEVFERKEPDRFRSAMERSTASHRTAESPDDPDADSGQTKKKRKSPAGGFVFWLILLITLLNLLKVFMSH